MSATRTSILARPLGRRALPGGVLVLLLAAPNALAAVPAPPTARPGPAPPADPPSVGHLVPGPARPAAGEETPPTVRWEPYTTVGSDGQPLEGELGRIDVPEHRDGEKGATIELAFVRFRTSHPDPGPPVFFLAGGPGGSGIEGCVGPATGRRVRLLDVCDVVAVDQRGTGRSRPDLASGPSFGWELPLDRPVSRDEYVEAYRSAVARCVAHWRAQGVDLSAYHTAASADDLDDVRRALGLDEIALWGSSYGSHLGLAYLRRHGEHVARAVLTKVEGPDHTLKLPGTTQAHLERLAELVAADPALGPAMPDLTGTVARLLETLADETPAATARRDGTDVTVTLGPFDLRWTLANQLGLLFETASVPAALARMDRGDWSDLVPYAWELRRGEVGSAMALMMDCASGASPARRRRIAREAAEVSHLLGDAVNVPYPDVCSACDAPDLGPGFRGPLRSEVPVLFVSGDLDARTPPENVEELLEGFPRAVHVVAGNVGHEPLEVLSPAFHDLLFAFLRGERIKGTTITMPPPHFEPIH